MATPPQFESQSLNGAAFSNANLQGCVFTDVNLTDVSIDNAKIDGLTIFGHDIRALIQAEIARRREG